MLPLLLVSGLLNGAFWWGSCASLDEERPLEMAVVTLNESCGAQVLQRVRLAVLRLLRLERSPGFPAETTEGLRQDWAKEAGELLAVTSSAGQNLNISSNQTMLSRRGSCTQISHHITLADLGWQSWLLHPTSFLFTECLGCHCHRKDEAPPLDLWVRECTPGFLDPPAGRDPKQRRCCRPRRTPLPFAFLKDEGSLVIQTVRLTEDCDCRP